MFLLEIHVFFVFLMGVWGEVGSVVDCGLSLCFYLRVVIREKELRWMLRTTKDGQPS